MLALYRKYRPRTLEDVIGQEQVTKPLSSALKSGKTSHSYLFTGPRGCGKTSVARILAHEINGFKYELEDSYLDIIEIDAASNTGVDNIRDLREKALIAPSEGKYKVYIIDEVHMLSKSAFNALLKTLEEPPAHVVFILATTDIEKVPVTITSRSQVYTFRLAPPEIMLPHLKAICKKEKINIEDAALNLIVEKGGGSFRDSLSILDQISTVAEDHTITETEVSTLLGLPLDSKISSLLDAYAKGDSKAITDLLKSLLLEGIKPESIASSALSRIIATPTPELLPLLGELPKVSAPYPDAKLLLAFLSSSGSSFEAAKENSRIFRGDYERVQSMAGVSRSALRSARLIDEKNPTEFSQARKNLPDEQPTAIDRKRADQERKSLPDEQPSTKSQAKSIRTEPEHESTPHAATALTPALKAQLSKCRVEDDGEVINIYPSRKIVKTILERPANRELLKSNFDKAFIIHDPDELAKSPEISKISDIMGNVQEVNNNGGIPFE
ncbi:DNA polymerase III subunit gamma/tau [Candidatus Saccharibacteria bacterium]|nr:DNA polymerase III subunit gamma/tau [Candidatus Saccharibacteria bacterium]